MAATFALIQSPRVRYAMGSMMYFAQGIPQGLLAIAIPAWLASLGVGAGEISSYMAVIVLPWAFKLVTGPFMDRYQFPAMGRRRPWIRTCDAEPCRRRRWREHPHRRSDRGRFPGEGDGRPQRRRWRA